MFKDCLAAFRVFAQGRNSPVELERNKPSRAGQIEFVEEIKRRTANDEDAWAFWAIQIDFDPEA
jgi:hypothetical protein